MSNKILPTIAFLAAIGIFFGYINPAWTGSIATTKANIIADDQALVAAGQYRAQQDQLSSARNAINTNDIKRLSVFLPDSVDNVGLILNLNALAARTGISLSNVDVTANSESLEDSTGILPASVTNPIGSADMSLSAVGTYTALQSFLKEVESSERLLDVQDIVVKGSSTGVYTYNVNLRLYWLR
ncbi:MAG: hypothetical protein WCS97_00550 [Candidatus Paceibacterota bacterium]|jgi:Tfp pilus assembly protein PilO